MTSWSTSTPTSSKRSWHTRSPTSRLATFRSIFGAGVLRDAVGWNPIAHFAFRWLLTDRELEADRRAAVLTGRPLAVASGLLKMCDLVGRRPRLRHRVAVGFLRPGGRITRRVSHLIALADGTTVAGPDGRIPYLVAGLLVAVLGLQVRRARRRARMLPLSPSCGAPRRHRPDSSFSPPARQASSNPQRGSR